MSLKRWTIVALANKPYLQNIRWLAETLKASGTNAKTVFSLVNCTTDLPVDETIHEKVSKKEEVHYCIWGKPRTLRRIIERGDCDYVVWIAG